MSTRPHVLIIVQNLPVPLDRRVWLECQALVGAGYDVSVICPKGPGDPAYQELEGVEIHKYRPAPAASGIAGYGVEFGYSLAVASRLAVKVHRRKRIDVIQACNPPDTYWLLARAFKRAGVRFVYDQHDLCPEVYESRFEDPSLLLLSGLRALERATYRTADHVISTNESYKAVAMRRGRRRPEDVSVVRSGPDTSQMRKGVAVPDLRHGREHLLCYLGIMGPQDGVDQAVHAVDVLVHELGRTDVHAKFLGFGDCLEDLRHLAHELGLDDHVSFPGRVDIPTISRYLSTAAVGLCPDPKNPLNDVSTMNKTMEYMAHELAVVSYDLAETRVSAGEAAVYVPSGDVAGFARAVADLLDDPARRARMGELGRARILDALAWHHQAPVYVSVYDALCGVDRATGLSSAA